MRGREGDHLTLFKKLLPVVAAAVLAAAAAGVLVALRTPARLLTASDSYVLKSPTVQARPTVLAHSALAWCGTSPSAGDRLPDATGGDQIHVIYAIPSDGTDRSATMAPAIATDLAAVDAWWRQQDPARTLRFDMFAFPGCAPGFGQLDISDVRLPETGSVYADSSTRFPLMVTDLGGDFNDPGKKYLVYYDGPLDDTHLCGQSIESPTTGGRFSFSLIYAQACHPDIGTGALTASVVAHELGHNLGAVPPGAPNSCPGDFAHACDNELDLMYPVTHGEGIGQRMLDVGRNDYYGHGGPQWDIRNSAWLAHLDAPQFPLAVSLAGSSGKGTVESDQPGIACPSSCSAVWDQGAVVTLIATPADGSRFLGWTGACKADPCTVTMSQAQFVGARFSASADLTVIVQNNGGSGAVRGSPGVVCSGSCTKTLDRGTRVTLKATPAKGSAFTGWGGACSGRAGCTITLSSSTVVSASFGPPTAFKPPAPKCKKGQRPTRAKPCRR